MTSQGVNSFLASDWSQGLREFLEPNTTEAKHFQGTFAT